MSGANLSLSIQNCNVQQILIQVNDQNQLAKLDLQSKAQAREP